MTRLDLVVRPTLRPLDVNRDASLVERHSVQSHSNNFRLCDYIGSLKDCIRSKVPTGRVAPYFSCKLSSARFEEQTGKRTQLSMRDEPAG